ncbi:lipid IV(A) 3-deoxy-D-manno-octulosonic acid transferase [Rheinheimera maricola]|uniref:3-deoxy-D-manno-octulosonic acid kinase n=1 Tax=Rheinheimera maricola TaxID=2793282 RepID=A0ABS7XA47_9GAMM|nr:lipid IV(A) 3-deoxy-D-manno-octulosonic acid transferase [Rheinheimera maricola]MBZ9612423.1 lipid IV(A) 3-deoxy-D-manno-octulosonic acid transferase [Rheinheimera maricola]
MTRRVAQYAYNLLLWLLLPWLMAYFLLRSAKAPAYRQRLAERLALQAIPQHALGGIVVHAVSVGEIVAATPLIKALQQHYPKLTITVTCTTPTGSARIVSSFADSVYHCYLPIDTPGAINRWLNKLQPQAVIILETELWPNLLQQCRRALIPSIVVNARLSARSARGYRRWQLFSRLALDNISLLLAQDRASARRFVALRCKGQINVCGNLKYDMALPPQLETLVTQFGQQFCGRQVWVAGSTHAGEDELLLQAYLQVKKQCPQLLLILVPRHPERFDAVALLAKQAGLSCVRRSSAEYITAATDVMLGDSMGELLAWYQLADVVFIGGSLISRGGHNPLEAMLFAKPIQSGPHVFNFATAYQWLNNASAVSWVSDVATLVHSTTQLLNNPILALHQGAAAQTLYQQHGGASYRMAQAITELLAENTSDFAVAVNSDSTSWFQRSVFAHATELSFDPVFWQQQQAVIGQSQGRNTAWFVRHNSHEFVVRHYYRGGLIGKLLQDKFSFQATLASRAMQEFALLRQLRRFNLPVPRPLAAQYQRHGLHYKSDLIIELVPQSRDLAGVLSAVGSLNDDKWQQLGALIARFHQHGVYHSDLNCHNILLDANADFWLIDFDKCALRPAGNWQQANLARLLRSLNKERSLQPTFYWQPSQWLALLQGYNQQLAG